MRTGLPQPVGRGADLFSDGVQRHSSFAFVLHFGNERLTSTTNFDMKNKLKNTTTAQHDAKLPVSCRCFMVFNPIGEDWEQMSIAFKTFKEAKVYYDRQDRKKYPYLRILAELSYNGS